MKFYESGRKHGQTALQSMDLYSRLLTAKKGERFLIVTSSRTVQVTVTKIEETPCTT